MPDEKKADPPTDVTVEIKLNGRGVAGFQYKQFADKRTLPPDKARKLVEFWLALDRE